MAFPPSDAVVGPALGQSAVPTARTASGSVRGVCRAGSSSRPQPDSAASSITRSGPEPSEGTAKDRRRSPWSVPLRKRV